MLVNVGVCVQVFGVDGKKARTMSSLLTAAAQVERQVSSLCCVLALQFPEHFCTTGC